MERDLRDASAVCRQLGIPLHEADFVSAYWNQVGAIARAGPMGPAAALSEHCLRPWADPLPAREPAQRVPTALRCAWFSPAGGC